jgi:hypothetical protein
MWNDLDAILSLTVGFIAAIALVLVVLSVIEDDLVSDARREPVPDTPGTDAKELAVERVAPDDQ